MNSGNVQYTIVRSLKTFVEVSNMYDYDYKISFDDVFEKILHTVAMNQMMGAYKPAKRWFNETYTIKERELLRQLVSFYYRDNMPIIVDDTFGTSDALKYCMKVYPLSVSGVLDCLSNKYHILLFMQKIVTLLYYFDENRDYHDAVGQLAVIFHNIQKETLSLLTMMSYINGDIKESTLADTYKQIVIDSFGVNNNNVGFVFQALFTLSTNKYWCPTITQYEAFVASVKNIVIVEA